MSNSYPDPGLISSVYGLPRKLFPDPVTITQKVAYTFGISMHLRPDLPQTHAASASIAPGTQKLTHSPGR